ncbi:MAG TPA: hypothetical protein VHJ34_01570 [Actinomycetota bacterium]|nr:hypothetical protein [Actinomycetota bacterium]
MRVLFVCTGNICRSPMAEALLRAELDRRGCRDVEVASCGTWADDGVRASDGTARVLRARGIDVAAHRSRAATRAEVAAADLVVAMTSVHVRELTDLAPEAAPKTRLLKEIALIEPRPAGTSAAARVAELLAAPRPPARRSLDVDDPFSLTDSAYDRCLADVDAGVAALADVLCPG